MEDPLLIPQTGEDQPTPTLRRIPHLGHALLFVSTAYLILNLVGLVLLALLKYPVPSHDASVTLQRPKLQILAQALVYIATLVAAWLGYPLLWHRPFADGIRWNGWAVRSQAAKLIPLGILLSIMVQVVTHFIPTPKTIPIDNFFVTASAAWLITLFGTTLAPLFEEITFRGFLLPAFAIAYDWLSLPRTPEAALRWRTSTTLTPAAYLFSAIVTSILFAALHAQQVAHAWPVLIVLFCVSLVLTLVRVRTQSVAASTLVHSAYNSLIFLAALIGTGGYRHLERMTQ